MLKLFGYEFWTAFKDGLNALPSAWAVATAYGIGAEVVYGNDIWQSLVNPNTGNVPVAGMNWALVEANNRWLLLKNGAAYTYRDINYKWVGMEKLCKPMIYSLWLRDGVDNVVTGAGNVKANAENATVVSPNLRIVNAWNQYDNLAVGPWATVPYRIAWIDSLFGYLLANSTTFDDVAPAAYVDFLAYLNNGFRAPGRQNVFDL